ncbi:hypothetical protein ACJ41O_015009 [Fusarium nematophilum]
MASTAAVEDGFTNKAYIVTGGFSGIGLATVHKLLRASAVVHVLDRDQSPPAALDEAKSSGRLYLYPSVDVSSRESVSKTFAEILKRSPKISGLVNSAGICPSDGTILENDDTFDRVIAVNLRGTWNVSTELLRHVQETSPASSFEGWKPGQGGISIVNLGSSASYYGFQTLGAYTASKHAVLGLTRTWALDFARFGVRVNLVAPGGTTTPLSLAQFEYKTRGDMSREVAQYIPMKRFGEPGEQADAIVFLLGDQASYITGQLIGVNGGWP